MVNWDRISELRDEIGEDDYAEVVTLFFAEVDAAIERLAVPATLKQRESDLHFLKGSSLNLGFDTLGGLCEVGERNAARGTLAEGEVQSVIEAYHASRVAFENGA